MIDVVLTSFEAFGGHELNSSQEVGRALAREPMPGLSLDWVVLPVVADHCIEVAWARIARVRPALVLALGQATGATSVRIEERAVNRNHFTMPDNAGNEFQHQVIVPGAPPVYRATVHPGRLLRELRGADVAAELSGSAGTYLCNHLFYSLLHRAAVTGCSHQTGFLHLPLLPEQVTTRRPLPSRSLGELVEGVRRAIWACVAPTEFGCRSLAAC
jgi:pyroglutamyl-peptidase